MRDTASLSSSGGNSDDTLDTLADDLQQALQLSISWEGEGEEVAPVVRVVEQDAMAGKIENPGKKGDAIRVNCGGAAPLSQINQDIQIDQRELEKMIQSQLGAKFGAFIDFGKGPRGNDSTPSDSSVSPQTIRIPAANAAGASFKLEGMTDYHISSGGKLRREKVSLDAETDPEGALTFSLLPGSYTLSQTSAPEGCLVNEKIVDIAVGSQGYAIDGNQGQAFAGVASPRAARRYRAIFRKADGEPIPNAHWLIEGDADIGGNDSLPYAARAISSASGEALFALPLGRFIVSDGEPPNEPILSIEVTEASSDVDAMDVTIDSR
ncbi:MAG: prealbumin-like fold domain-containing protein [Oscillospiraceae bacterium]|jgi:hypothetical protein|nr:prealbumin-like fold domain-containing protein [Oscillospiraceae bacterium]